MKEHPVKRGDLLEIYVDGASRGNPGPAAYGFIFVNRDKIIYQNSGYIGNKTNNTAEYTAIINALNEAKQFSRWDLKIFSDSELVVRQINKKYRITKSHLSKLCHEVYKLSQFFEKVEFFNVGRSNAYIKKSDLLCNECLDAKGFKGK
jgi:ribonuclease HI